MSQHSITFSVVVCVFNGEHRIGATLKSIQKLDYPKNQYEIIVVDDGSTDQTIPVIKRLRGKRIRLERHATNLGISTARNTGLHSATGKYVAYVDDDCTVNRQWLKQLEASLRRENTLAAGGHIDAKSQKHLTQRYLIANGYGRPAAVELGKAKSPLGRFAAYIRDTFTRASGQKLQEVVVHEVYGANSAFEREKLRTVGGFPTELRTAEDTAICNRLRDTYPGQVIRFNPRATVKHDFTPSFGAYLAKLFRRQADTLAYYQSQRNMPPVYPFPFLVALTSLLSGLITWWLAPVTLCLLPLAAYSWWTIAAMRQRRLEPLAYVYMQWCEETVRCAGLLRALAMRSKRPYFSTVWPLVALSGSLLLVHSARINWLQGPLALGMIIVPGYILLCGIGAWHILKTGMLRLSLSVVAGLAWLLLIGLALVVVLPLAGIDKPLQPHFVISAYGISVLGLALLALRRKKPVNSFQWPVWHIRHIALYSVAIVLPFLSFIGANMLNNGNSNAATLIMFGVSITLICLAVWRSKTLPPSLLPAILFSVSASALLSYTLRSPYLFGWDIQQEFEVFLQTYGTGNWIAGQAHDPYSAMLSLTVLPSMLANFAGVNGLNIFKTLFPLLFSFVPVLLYYGYRLCTKRWLAFAAAGVFIAQFYFMQQFAGLARQQIAFLFFAGLLFLLTQTKIQGKARITLVSLCMFGMITSHYSTTYLAIALLTGAYILVKLFRWLRPGLHLRPYILPFWVVGGVIAGAVLWYGPVTHSSALLAQVAKSHDYASLPSRISQELQAYAQKEEPPAGAGSYLSTIGATYRSDRPYLEYYPEASNDDIHPVESQQISGYLPLLRPLASILDTVLRHAWWILGSLGVIWFIGCLVKRRPDSSSIEVAMLAVVAVLAFVAIHTIPEVANYYNIPRLNQQALIFMALPAVLALAWLGRKLSGWVQKAIVLAPVIVAFLIASGIMAWLAGGVPTANLHNAGNDYQRFYIHTSEVAAAEWLQHVRQDQTVIYADRYAGLRLIVPTGIHAHVMSDVTPETLAVGSYVYASYTNTVDDTSMAGHQGDVVTFTFPQAFISEHKNTLYSNGYAEVHK